MKNFKMKKILPLALVALFVANLASAMTLNELVEVVRKSATESSAENRKRVNEFKNQRNQQQALLTKAKATLKALEAETDALKTEFDANEETLANLETVLHERSGNLGEMHGTVKILAGDLRSRLEHSFTSAQFSGRSEFLKNLAANKELPNIEDLKKLWLEFTKEIAEQAKIVKFIAPVLNGNGEIEENINVIRLGVFNAFDMKGNFLTWNEEGSVLYRNNKQPTGKYKDMAVKFVNAAPGAEVHAPIDYSKGQILELVTASPSLKEKVKQGGLVGYVIIGLGIVGLLLALIKFLSLLASGSKIKSQLKNKTPKSNNALGRIMSVYTENPDADIETMELKMDEAILRETAPLESGLSFIKVMYVIAPLMGLLGTVVGMIATFQMITLFGTGDPKSMAGGISQALVTTVLGLVVAIPLTILHSVLQSMARKQTQILEEQSAGIIARIAEK